MHYRTGLPIRVALCTSEAQEVTTKGVYINSCMQCSDPAPHSLQPSSGRPRIRRTHSPASPSISDTSPSQCAEGLRFSAFKLSIGLFAWFSHRNF